MPHASRNGVQFFFEEAGSGAPAAVLIHGWCCDHTYLAPQLAHLGRSRRVVAVDLRGHGQSDAPEQAYTIAGFADDLVWLCHHLAIERPVLIGHSMGGLIALEIAARHASALRPTAVVTLDAPLVPQAGVLDGVAPILEAFRGPNHRQAQRDFIGSVLFAPGDDRARKAQVVGAMSAVPQHVMVSAFESILAYDSAASVRACRAPLLVVLAAGAVTDLPRLRALRPDVAVGQTVGAGHFHQLEVPEQVNAMIDRFVKTVTGGR